MCAAGVETGQLVRVRGQQWVVSDVSSAAADDTLSRTHLAGRTLASLTSVSEDDLGDELSVIWEVESDAAIIPAGALPDVTESSGWDPPQMVGALLDAVRWGTVASADVHTLQAPFRSGIQIKDYQLEPVAKALAMPRVSLLVADDVGLGKTIEAGLVIDELLLRHRARRVIVVCPAPLTGKWREELQEKFGLDFAVLDTAALARMRRTHGLQANPFTVFPRMIISLPWLRTPRVQRLLDEVLVGRQGTPFFDLLVVDEAHHCAPPAPQRGARGYAVDSKQTQAVRLLSDSSQHRMLLSATPHNGYSESWQALLALLDPQRFVRGAPPDATALEEVLVRRLKDQIVDSEGKPEFAPRLPVEPIEVEYTDAEREGHALLAAYAALRTGSSSRNDLITLLLKKRLFSSPAAFAQTLEQHRRTAVGRRSTDTFDPDFESEYDLDDEPDDAIGSDEEGALMLAAATPLSPDALAALDRLLTWARQRVGPADRKAGRLVDELNAICRPGGTWNEERVILFTEYRDTQTWLAGLLDARGLGGDRLGLLHGGMDGQRREHLKAAFQADPSRDPVRILLATDSASEGIDLQNHCCRVINYDIPFNPNRLEQRIGRVDRFGQTRPVHVAHFVGAGWTTAAEGSYEADLEFLSRVAEKVAVERQDLGRVNPVLARAVESRMLGRPVLDDPFAVSATTSPVRAERDLRAQIARLHTQLDRSVAALHVAPANVRRVVDTALQMAGQPALVDRPDGLVEPPVLTRGWERTVAGLADPLDENLLRPLTFDARRAGPDVVHAHLGHALVDQSQRLLRSAVWGEHSDLARVTGVSADLPDEIRSGELLVTVVSRLVVVGSDGARLHEEVFYTGRALPTAGGRSRRVEVDERRYEQVRAAVEAALEPEACRPASAAAQQLLVSAWPQLREPLAADVTQRAEARTVALGRLLEERREDEVKRLRVVTEHLRRTLTDVLAEPAPRQLTFDELDGAERQQLQSDREVWAARLEHLDADRERDEARLQARYAGRRELTFPVAVVLAAPESAA